MAQATALIDQLPATFGLLRKGEVSEHVAVIVVTETSHLRAHDRRLVDAQLTAQLVGVGPRRAQVAARRLAIQVDQAGAVKRASNALEDRRVSIRPAPDTMAIVRRCCRVSKG